MNVSNIHRQCIHAPPHIKTCCQSCKAFIIYEGEWNLEDCACEVLQNSKLPVPIFRVEPVSSQCSKCSKQWHQNCLLAPPDFRCADGPWLTMAWRQTWTSTSLTSSTSEWLKNACIPARDPKYCLAVGSQCTRSKQQ